MTLIATAHVDGVTGYAQVISVGPHQLTADEPATAGGTDTGASPAQLLLAALGACSSITLRMYAQRKGWELGAVHVELRLFKAADPQAPAHAYERIERELRFDAPLSDEQRVRLVEIVEKTPITVLVKRGVTIETRFAV